MKCLLFTEIISFSETILNSTTRDVAATAGGRLRGGRV
jgi:hypothetical protein